MHEFLATAPFDLYGVHLFHLIARSGSFTKAAALAGLTQSAITRQIQGMEARLELQLFERTTRRVQLTRAGEFFLQQTSGLLSSVETCLRRMREEFGNAPREVRVGVSQTISLAYLPGFFVAHRRAHPEVQVRITHQPGRKVLDALEAGDIDLGLLCPPKRLSPALAITHRFQDGFVLILPKQAAAPAATLATKVHVWQSWLRQQNWLLIHEESNTGSALRRWLNRRGWNPATITEADNFDLIINLVALGMGISVVPHRALALYGRSRALQRFRIADRFSRDLVVLVRRSPAPAAHVSEFVEHVLF